MQKDVNFIIYQVRLRKLYFGIGLTQVIVWDVNFLHKTYQKNHNKIPLIKFGSQQMKKIILMNENLTLKRFIKFRSFCVIWLWPIASCSSKICDDK